ncbi:hypothetical protein, partial [Mycolicibacterium sp. 120322]|uniref:hypothetical protein n=1 Tax=Mycolicibacterium sp. 120322 TaxID=3096109 RepID=UPI002EDA0160
RGGDSAPTTTASVTLLLGSKASLLRESIGGINIEVVESPSALGQVLLRSVLSRARANPAK